MFKLSIPLRLIALSALLLGALSASSFYFFERMSENAEVLSEEARAFGVLKSANAANKAFGDLKYALAQRIAAQQIEPDEGAARARVALEAHLAELMRHDAEAISVVNLELESVMNTTDFAVEAYANGQHARGEQLRAKSIEHIAVVDQRLSGLVELLEVEATRQRETTIEATRHTVRNAIVVLTVAGLIGLALTFLILRSITVPLRRLVNSIKRITSGDLDTPVPAAGSDEIGAMTRALSLFRDSLQERDRLAAERARADAAMHRAQAQLAEALESVSDAFVFYDADDRLVTTNRNYRDVVLAGIDATAEVGMRFVDIARCVAESGVVLEARGRVDEWVEQRLAEHRNPVGPRLLQRRADGRWLQLNERKTNDGGTVGVYMDVTELKQREEELAAANRAQDALLRELHAVLEGMDYAVMLLDSDLRTRISNRAYRDLWGFPETFFDDNPTLSEEMEYAQAHGMYGVTDDDWAEYRVRRLEEIRNGVTAPRELALPGERFLQYKCTVLPDGGRMLSFFDISELKRRERELAVAIEEKDATLGELHAVVDAIDYGVLFVDEALRIRLTNRAYRELWGLPEEFFTATTTLQDDMAATRLAGAYAIADFEWDEYCEQRIEEVREGEFGPIEMHLADGKVVQYQCVSLPHGGRMLTYFDITKLKLVEHELRESRQRYELAVRGSNDGLWDWDAATNQIYISPRFKTIAGLKTKESFITPERWKLLVHDDDQLRHIADMRAHLKGETESFSTEYRIRGDDGSYRWVHNRGLCVRDESGQVYRMAGSLSDISERKEAEFALRDAKEQAEAATRVKSQFIANMSHELRTPLNAVIGIAEMLQEEAEEDEDYERVEPVRRIVTAGRHLLRLISEILDLSKIEAGRLEIHHDDFDLCEMAEELVTTMEPLASQNGNEIEASCPVESGMMCSDVVRVRQILLNLLSNSCKFTQDGKVWLKIGGDAGSETVSFTVTDTGIGMTEQQLENLFEEFAQADSSTTRRYGGTGLGLSISRRLCDLLGGEIDVETEVDVGTTFVVRLPRNYRARQTSPPRADRHAAVGDSLKTAGL